MRQLNDPILRAAAGQHTPGRARVITVQPTEVYGPLIALYLFSNHYSIATEAPHSRVSNRQLDYLVTSYSDKHNTYDHFNTWTIQQYHLDLYSLCFQTLF